MIGERDRRNISAEIARQGRPKYQVAAAAGVHPSRFARMLSGKAPMPHGVYQSTCTVLGLVLTPKAPGAA